jgi:hypothetical protein
MGSFLRPGSAKRWIARGVCFVDCFISTHNSYTTTKLAQKTGGRCDRVTARKLPTLVHSAA